MGNENQLLEAIQFSWESMSIITWLVLVFGVFKSVGAFINAYKDNKTYSDMMANKDKTGITQFYYGVIISILCVLIFFLPYILK